MRFVLLNLLEFVAGAFLRATFEVAACVIVEGTWWLIVPFPGALRFLDSTGCATLLSGLTEKLDMPGK